MKYLYAVLGIVGVLSSFTPHPEIAGYCIMIAFFAFVGRGVFWPRSKKWVAAQHYISPDGTRFWSKGNAIATLVIFGIIAVLTALVLNTELPPEGRGMPIITVLCSVYVGVALARLFPRLLLRKDEIIGPRGAEVLSPQDIAPVSSRREPPPLV